MNTTTYDRSKFIISNPNSTPLLALFIPLFKIGMIISLSSAIRIVEMINFKFIKQFSLPPQLTCTGRNSHLNRSMHLVKQATPNPYDILCVSLLPDLVQVQGWHDSITKKQLCHISHNLWHGRQLVYSLLVLSLWAGWVWGWKVFVLKQAVEVTVKVVH